MAAIDRFNMLFDNCKKTVPFSSKWNIWPDYFVLRNLPQLKAGETVRSVDVDSRKIIIFGTECGSSIVFQLYAYTPSISAVCYNVQDDFASMFDLPSWKGQLYEEELIRFAKYFGLD